MKHLLMIFALLIVFAVPAQRAQADAAPEVLWWQSWDGVGDFPDEAKVVAVDADGSVVVLGQSYEPGPGNQLVIQRYTSNGGLLWSRTLPDLGTYKLRDVQLTPDGSAVFASRGHDAELGSFLGLTQVDAAGNVVWQHRTYGDITSGIPMQPSLGRDSEGNWCTYTSWNSEDMMVLKVDPAGQLLWSRVLDLGVSDVPTDIAVDSGDLIYIGGVEGLDGHMSVCLSAEGDSLWSVVHSPDVSAAEVWAAAMPDGGAVFTGVDESIEIGAPASGTWRVDAAGNILWQGQYPALGELATMVLTDLLVTEDGRIVVLGSGGPDDIRFYAQCFDAQGQELWQAAAAGEGSVNYMYAAALAPRGHIVTGGSQQPFGGVSTFFLAGFTPQGEVGWTQSWNRTPGEPDRLADVAVGPDGTIVAVGHSWAGTGNGGAQWAIVKFAAPVSAAEDVPAPEAATLHAYPNPFNPRTRIRYTVEQAGAVRLSVHDVAGRLVRTLVQRDHVAGRHELTWYGRDDAGRAQASGTYLLRLETATGVSSSRLALVR